ncbi:nucleotide sugar dehydrogenase [Haloferula chungangensis]|uniref:Nucleotide sugar dehydrogenase n=1 Tax=Haloferula chungangensis TaxID=1048331 RepID=A0ABW2LAI1_9BACT
MELIEKIKSKKALIGIVGLGYVGLPLGLGFIAKGHRVLGLDIDSKKTAAILSGSSYIEHIDAQPIADGVKSGLLDATTDFARAGECDALILCVPTPLSDHHEPDLSYVLNTLEFLLPYLRRDQVISLESTTYPGTTDEELRPRIENLGLTVGKDIFLVYSPEREDPGNAHFSSVNIPKVMGGSTPACAEVGLALYQAVVEQVVPVSSTQVAEFSKLLENIYRSVNIGLANELKVAADKMGIDIWEVIQAAATKPFGFKAFYPGPGLGGHCIPIDPFYLTWKAREFGVHTRFIELSGEINEAMPAYVVQKTAHALNTRQKSVNGSRILILGLAYKENVDDMRESPTFHLMDGLDELGAEVDYHDPHIPEIIPTREHAKWTGRRSIEITPTTLASYDCVLISTNHSRVDLVEVVANSSLIVDTRNAIASAGLAPKEGQLFKA